MDVESRETLYSTIGQWRLSNHFRMEDRRQQAKVSDQSDLFIFFYIFIIFFWRDSTTAARASFGRRREKNSEKKIFLNEKTKKRNPNQPKKKTKNAKRNLRSKRERERESAWVGADQRLGWPSSVASTSFERRRRPAAFSTALIAFRWRQRHREREREKRPSLTRFGGCKRAD